MYDKKLFNALNAKVNVDMFGASKRRHGVTSESLYPILLISIEAARRTIQHTTQRVIRTIIHPYLSCRFKTNDRALRYNRLQKNVFTETIQAGTVSRIGN